MSATMSPEPMDPRDLLARLRERMRGGEFSRRFLAEITNALEDEGFFPRYLDRRFVRRGHEALVKSALHGARDEHGRCLVQADARDAEGRARQLYIFRDDMTIPEVTDHLAKGVRAVGADARALIRFADYQSSRLGYDFRSDFPDLERYEGLDGYGYVSNPDGVDPDEDDVDDPEDGDE